MSWVILLGYDGVHKVLTSSGFSITFVIAYPSTAPPSSTAEIEATLGTNSTTAAGTNTTTNLTSIFQQNLQALATVQQNPALSALAQQVNIATVSIIHLTTTPTLVPSASQASESVPALTSIDTPQGLSIIVILSFVGFVIMICGCVYTYDLVTRKKAAEVTSWHDEEFATSFGIGRLSPRRSPRLSPRVSPSLLQETPLSPSTVAAKGKKQVFTFEENPAPDV